MNSLGQMEENIMGHILMIKNMDMVSSNGQMVEDMKDYGKMDSNMEKVPISPKPEKKKKETGKKEKKLTTKKKNKILIKKITKFIDLIHLYCKKLNSFHAF